MKTESMEVNGLPRLENEEILNEFEMIELKGGTSVSSSSNNTNCTNTNCNKKCNKKCSSDSYEAVLSYEPIY